MKRIGAVMAGVLLLAGSTFRAEAMSFPGKSDALELRGSLNSPIVPGSGGRAFLQLALTAPRGAARERKPVNLCVVLDRSGSMGEEGKIVNAKAALNALIDRLSRDDIFSLVIYDDVVDVLRPAGCAGDRRELHDLVEGIQPRGWTNLGGGMLEGFSQVERYARREYVNRVVLLSDGLANRGITDPRDLGRFARKFRERSISLTTMGVGLDYNENLMTSLAGWGGGNYYFIESPRQLASILGKEFDMLGCVAAQNTVIDLTLGRGVKVLDVVGTEFAGGDGHVRIPVGDVYAGERREFTVELEIPAGTGTRLVAEGTVRFEPVRDRVSMSRLESVNVTYSSDAAEIERHRDLETQARADVALSTRGVERAMNALDEGKGDVAQEELAAARRVLLASPAAGGSVTGAAIKEQDAKLGTYQQRLKDGPAELQKAKKAIQYDNYKTRRGEEK
jgi:Ca-activated chloride channel family protein